MNIATVTESNVAGAVLAGGRSSRFGRDKAVEPVRGRPMAATVLAALELAGCQPVVLVGGEPAALALLDREVVPDLWPGEGPLGGVLTALRSLDADVVVAACDLAVLDAATVAAVIAAGGVPGVDVAIAVADERHVALGRWNQSGLAALERRFEIGERSLRGVLDHVETCPVAVDPSLVRDVDTVVDLHAIERR